MRRLSWGWLAGALALWVESGGRLLAEDDPASIVYWVPSTDILSKKTVDAQEERKKAAKSDLDLETSMREKGYFWVNGGWVKKGETIVAARSAGELKDSDRDGFDDFTEVKFHSDPFDARNSPEAYFRAKGSNRAVFFTTNASARSK